MHHAEKRRWMTETSEQFGLLALGLLAWGLAEGLGGNGFISAFVGGLFVKFGFGAAREMMVDFGEAWGQLLSFAATAQLCRVLPLWHPGRARLGAV